ncbi:MAG: hypothetical protein ACM30G_16275 [Micromonosporaceae bacterium]
MTTDWVEEPRTGWISRLLVPREPGRASSLTLGIATLATAAFVASVVLDWRVVTVDLTAAGGSNQSGTTTAVFRASVGDATSLSSAYLLGMVALLGLVGAAAGRAELAVRMRHAASGVGVGLLGLVFAVFFRQADLETALGANYGGFVPELPDNVKSEAGPGSLFAAAAVALATAAVWTAARAAMREGLPARGEPGDEADETPIDHPYSGMGGGFAMSVQPAGALDLTVTPDGTSRRLLQ